MLTWILGGLLVVAIVIICLLVRVLVKMVDSLPVWWVKIKDIKNFSIETNAMRIVMEIVHGTIVRNWKTISPVVRYS